MIVFIGAGRAGTGLGKYFIKKGIDISGFFDLDQEKSRGAAKSTGTRFFDNLSEAAVAGDIFILSTGDDVIASAAKELFKVLNKKEVTIGHLSGMHSSIMLKEIFKNFPCFSLHPLHSFAGAEDENLETIVFTLEGDEQGVERISEEIKKTGNILNRIKPEDKVLYHGACVFASNYVTTLVSKSMDLLKKVGIDYETSIKMLEPLVKGTVDSAFEKYPWNSLTGPVARGDINTVKGHLHELEKVDKETMKLYKALGRVTLELAGRNLLEDKEKINSINELMRE